MEINSEIPLTESMRKHLLRPYMKLPGKDSVWANSVLTKSAWKSPTGSILIVTRTKVMVAGKLTERRTTQWVPTVVNIMMDNLDSTFDFYCHSMDKVRTPCTRILPPQQPDCGLHCTVRFELPGMCVLNCIFWLCARVFCVPRSLARICSAPCCTCGSS